MAAGACGITCGILSGMGKTIAALAPILIELPRNIFFKKQRRAIQALAPSNLFIPLSLYIWAVILNESQDKKSTPGLRGQAVTGHAAQQQMQRLANLLSTLRDQHQLP